MINISLATLAMQCAGEAKRNIAKIKAREASLAFICAVLKPLQRRELLNIYPKTLSSRTTENLVSTITHNEDGFTVIAMEVLIKYCVNSFLKLTNSFN